MGFKADEKVELLDYDLKPYLDESGTIPEPSQDGRFAFQEALMAAVGVDGDIEGEGGTEAVTKLTKMSLAEQRKTLEALRDAVADVCGGSPSRDVILAMPARVYDSFSGWLMQELLNPNG